MSMLADMLSKLVKVGQPGEDDNIIPPDVLMKSQTLNSDPRNITNDSGSIVDYDMKDWSKGNPFSDAIAKSRAIDNTGPGVLRQLLSSVLGGGMVPGTGTVGGGGPPDHVPGTRQDAALNPQPLQVQRQPGLTPYVPLPAARPDYSQPTALDPVAIEQLRQSLLSDSGQLDPSNPNGLSGRMNSPNANVDMNNQRKETMSIEDGVRGFDGSRTANIRKGNQ